MNRVVIFASRMPVYLFSGLMAVSCISANTAEAQKAAKTSLEAKRALGPQYYVSATGSDANDGSASRPWATLGRASLAAAPGTTIHVAAGRYLDSVVTTASGTIDRPIRYVSDHKWSAVIDPRTHGIFSWKNTGDYTDIDGFEIAGTDCNGIGLGGSHQRAIGNNVHNSAVGCNANPESGSGIDDYDYSTRENEIVENYVHDVGAVDPLCGTPKHNMIHGIYQANAGGRIEQNIVANNCAYGIHLWHAATHATITNNTVVNNRSGGIIVGSGDSPCINGGCPGGDDFTVVANNIVAFNGVPGVAAWGILEEAEAGGATGLHNRYLRNLSFQNVGGDFALDHGMQCSACIRGQDPMFVSVVDRDFELRKGSPALAFGATVEPNEVPDVRHPGSNARIGAQAEVARPER